MRQLTAVAALTLVLVACGSQPSGSARPAPSSVPSTEPSAGAAPGELLFAALEPGGDLTELRDTAVAIVRANGVAVAKAKFDPRQLPKIGPARPLPQPEARTAGGRVFFADAAGAIRSLTPDNKVAPVTSFPLSGPQQLLSFAVSPAGDQLVGAVFAFPPVHSPPPQSPIDPPFGPGDFTLQVLAARPGQPATTLVNRRWPQSSGLPRDPLEIVGWSREAPVSMIDTPPGTTGTGGRRMFGHVAELDTAGRPGPPIGGYSCDAWSILPDETVLCDDNLSAPLQHFSVRRKDGTVRFRLQATGDEQFLNLSLAPDGSRVVYLVNGGGPVVVREDGGKTALPANFRPQGWLNGSTVIGAIAAAQGGEGNMALVRLDKPTKLEDLGFKGFFVGVVQGG